LVGTPKKKLHVFPYTNGGYKNVGNFSVNQL